MSEHPELRRLLNRRQIESWLGTFTSLDDSLAMAIIDLDGRLFARSGPWDDGRLATLVASLFSKPASGFELGDDTFCEPLTFSAAPIGLLVVHSQSEDLTRILGRAVQQGLMLLLNEAGANRGLTAVALDGAHLSEETEMYARQLQALNAIGRELSTTLDLDPLLRRILRSAIDLTQTEEGAIFLIDEPTGDLVFSVVEGGPEHLVGKRIPAGKGIVGRVAATGAPQIVNDVQESRFWFDGIDKDRGFTTQSILAVPLIKGDEVIGVLEIINRTDYKPFRQQDVDRLTTFTSQAVIAMETARLHRAEVAKERMERELQLGHAMQSSLIPATTPQLSGWEFAAWWEPAREVSGDFYDFIRLNDEVGVVLADVADKGVHAALFMALARSTVRASLHALQEPAIGINEANRLISQDATGGMFVTLVYAEFCPDSGDITYVNAGHNPPFWYQAADDNFTELEPTGVFLGFDADIPFEEALIHCSPGDLVVFYTDGVTEAMNSRRELFGEARFQAELRRAGYKAPAGILEDVKRALREHVGDTPQSDDITLVIAKRKPGR